jgi:integrase
VWSIRVRLQLEHRARDLAMFNLAIDSKLRGCDLVRLQVEDVCAGGKAQAHLSKRQYARIVHAWVESAGLDSSAYGTHSMRWTKAAEIYKKTGNLRAVQLLLGHTKLESTVRYLGIEVDDALTTSEQVEL